ncbi:preprotein translocase subunit SecA [Priestia megaterium]|uniref:preprotein translocase subunit SecA n=1 Tax=Priestia megaterium TaxID=1404 RepID=UPI002E1F83A9|nr:preprotein translocase subunit SecA [Priestia megaterium]MED4284629.1 preprotein translocase subunit SecA [Priestia megaterium]
MGLQQYFDNKRIKKMMKLADKIVIQHKQVGNIEDSAFVTHTQQFRERLENGENEEQVQVEAFALAREAAKRVLGLEAYPVQLVGGLILSEGNVAEMKTGEGKTLVSLFAIYFEALNGLKVHLVTANDYLAERDKSVIGPVLEFLGLTVGLNVSGLSSEEKKAIYKKDVIYSTASELGFDYLRDNMVKNKFEQVQSGLDYVLIDEADSILIDEARTPLIISGQKKEDLGLYKQAKMIVSLLKDDEYEYNIESNSVWLTEAGMEKAQNFWKIDDLYSLESQNYLRATNLMLRAYFTMTKDKDYVVSNGEVVLVDQNTGRIMDGRRFSEGLHQAIEAKESVEIKDETMTLATVTIQNYFRMYKKIAGMTGTAKTEEEELQKIYNLDVLVVPTHRPIARIDDNDEIYLDKEEKAKAIIREIKERNEKGQPILVGTSSIEDNEWLSGLFTKNGIKHEVLNAKNHEREAEIISNAGQKGAVTIATNMAGRGTDIKLGDDVKELGGLAVIGTEKHESRRVDNQLKGRSGRQGDPGYSKFILSLEDDLIKRFNGQKIKDLAVKLKFPKEEPIKDRMVAKAISSAQKRMEGSNFDIRKNLLEYDEVMDLQRKFIYNERTNLMGIVETDEFTEKMIEEFICEEVRKRYDDGEPEEIMNWIVNELIGAVEKNLINLDTVEDVEESVVKVALTRYRKNRETIGNDIINQIEKAIFMDLLDQFWVRHLDQLVQLKEGIHLRAYAQTNPLIEYQREAASMFQDILAELRHYYCMNVLHFDISNIAKG